LEGIARLAYAQAMADMVRYSGFVADMSMATPLDIGLAPSKFK